MSRSRARPDRRRRSGSLDVALNVGAAQTNDRPTLIPSGGTATVTSKRFYVFLDVSLITPTPTSVRAQIELGGGLTWGG